MNAPEHDLRGIDHLTLNGDEMEAIKWSLVSVRNLIEGAGVDLVKDGVFDSVEQMGQMQADIETAIVKIGRALKMGEELDKKNTMH